MITASQLTCEYQRDPIGLDTARPRFAWILESQQRGVRQSACQILVAGSAEKLAADVGDKWDSGMVESDRSVNVAYEGDKLASGEQCLWKVRVWDADGKVSGWSEPAAFEMGLLEEADWQGEWIAAEAGISAPLLRKAFTIDGPVKRARAYVAGIGWHKLYVNGRHVGDHVMDPAPTWYDNILPFDLRSRVLYVTHDVTDLLEAGANAVGVLLGHGWYSSDDGDPPGRRPFADRPALLLQLNVEVADGRKISIFSNGAWKAARSPITANDIAAGEHYDARLEEPGWCMAGFDDSGWPSVAAAKAPSGTLVAQSAEPCKVTHRFKPTRMLKSADNSYIFDLGQYISGRVELRVRGPRGTKVTLRHAGRVNYETASLDTRNNRAWSVALQTDSYILKGNGLEVWHPRFTVHGFRYVEVIGYPGEPKLDAVEGQTTNTAVEASGSFSCSNELINRIHHNVFWTFLGSFQGIPQDAADRAERVAWLGDPGFVAEDYLYNFNAVRFWAKWLDDIADAQRNSGELPYICPPNWGESSYRPWPCWQCCYALFIWHLYRFYDDERVLVEHYEGLKKQVEYFRALAKDHILDEPLGDHMEPRDDGTSSFAPSRTPPALCGTAYYCFTTWIMAQSAGILGRSGENEEYASLAERIKNAFNDKFFNPQTNQYAQGSQTSNALALYLNLVPSDRRQAVLGNLVEDVLDKRGGHLSTGIIGTDALEQALPAGGRADVMYEIATKRTFPSWGYGVLNGQTTISEDFECSGLRSVSMKMLGSVEKFFYKDLAGLSPSSPGFRTIDIRPKVVGDLTWAKAAINSVRGRAAVEWKKGDGGLEMKVTIPANATAAVSVPKLGRANVEVTEGGRAIWSGGEFAQGAPGISGGRDDGDYVTFDVGSGAYAFRLVP
ncbi:MAG: family 78 glycoside hydrolase catalytic domain [Planctomycetota bacterium]|jgi:alpha-L-rhamnosidase